MARTEHPDLDGSIPRPAGTPSYRAEVAAGVKRSVNKVGLLSNGFGALVVMLSLTFLFPNNVDHERYVTLLKISIPAFVVYMAITLPLGRVISGRRLRQAIDWLSEERSATDAERAAALRYPLEFARGAGVFWGLAALLFGSFWLIGGIAAGDAVGSTILLGGLTACTLQYLRVERAMRPVTALALAGGSPPQVMIPGVAARLSMAWALATAVPLLGAAAFVVADISGADLPQGQLKATILFLLMVAIVVGLTAMRLAARSVADPVTAVQRALERVESGDLETRVDVDDGSEVGRLQAGFNRMAAGLEERERMRDLFGRHVGRDVARAALEREISLGGEVREVAALFVDLVGSTALAARRPPTEVVAMLNDFFRIVVEAAERHGGLVNKFEGDAALCVFGAPGRLDDHAGAALRAAREIRDRVARELPDLDLGVGVSAGRAVAGNVGAEHRYEYTVIGDPVNEAARLCELAKEKPERLLASEAALQRAESAEAQHWSLGEAVTLRGRDQPTRLATTPVDAVPA
jgi:adenylate cyclase